MRKLLYTGLVLLLTVVLGGCGAPGAIPQTGSPLLSSTETVSVATSTIVPTSTSTMLPTETRSVPIPTFTALASTPTAVATITQPAPIVSNGSVLFEDVPTIDPALCPTTTWSYPLCGREKAGIHPVFALYGQVEWAAPDKPLHVVFNVISYADWTVSAVTIGQHRFDKPAGMSQYDGRSWWIELEPLFEGYYPLRVETTQGKEWEGLLAVDENHTMKFSEGWGGHDPSKAPPVYEWGKFAILFTNTHLDGDQVVTDVVIPDTRAWIQSEKPSVGDLSHYIALLPLSSNLNDAFVGNYDQLRRVVVFPRVHWKASSPIRFNYIFATDENGDGKVDSGWLWNWVKGHTNCAPTDPFVFFDTGSDGVQKLFCPSDDNPGYQAQWDNVSRQIIPALFLSQWGPVDFTNQYFGSDAIAAIKALR